MARSSSRAARVYPSKVDPWLVIVLTLSLGAALAGAVLAGLEAGPMRVAQAIAIMTAVIGLVVWVLLQTDYTLDGRELVIRSGPFRWRIPVGDITGIETPEQQGILLRARSGPALSLDRITIRYGKGRRITISPADRKTFLADLKARQAA